MAPRVLVVDDDYSGEWQADVVVVINTLVGGDHARLAMEVHEAITRRLARSGPWSARDITIDEQTRSATRGRDRLELTPTEFRLLVALASRAGLAVSREQLLHCAWGCDYLGHSRLVDMAVRRLRRKLGPGEPSYITTVRSVGYRFELA